jgi:hypothetical protein
MKSLLPWDRYLANMRAAREQSGFEEADESARKAVADLHELEGEDATGYARKGAVGGAVPTTVSTVDDLEHAVEERLDTDHIIGLSLILERTTSSAFPSSLTCWTCPGVRDKTATSH